MLHRAAYQSMSIPILFEYSTFLNIIVYLLFIINIIDLSNIIITIALLENTLFWFITNFFALRIYFQTQGGGREPIFREPR